MTRGGVQTFTQPLDLKATQRKIQSAVRLTSPVKTWNMVADAMQNELDDLF